MNEPSQASLALPPPELKSHRILVARDVRKRFGEHVVLDGISLEVERGEVVCIIGPSGGGKTTFLRCINHLERIESGTIEVDGDLVGYRIVNGQMREDERLGDRAKALGDRLRLPALQSLQSPQTVLENIVLGQHLVLVRHVKRDEATRRAEELRFNGSSLSEKRDNTPRVSREVSSNALQSRARWR